MKKRKNISRENSETDAFDLINKFGTYNIQPTADTSDLFPMIAHELPNKIMRESAKENTSYAKKQRLD